MMARCSQRWSTWRYRALEDDGRCDIVGWCSSWSKPINVGQTIINHPFGNGLYHLYTSGDLVDGLLLFYPHSYISNSCREGVDCLTHLFVRVDTLNALFHGKSKGTPNNYPTRSNTLTFGTKHWFVVNGWVSWTIFKQFFVLFCRGPCSGWFWGKHD